MALFKSLMAQGRETPVTAGVAGVVVAQVAKYTAVDAGASGDVLALCVLPARAVLDSVDVIEDATAITADIGFVTKVGAVGAEATGVPAVLAIAKADEDRIIGYKLAGALAKGKVVTARIQYHF